MYQTLLVLHSWSRWFVVIFGLIAVYRAFVGYNGRRPFVSADNGMSAAFSGFMWLQVIIGLGLYFGDTRPWGLHGLQTYGMKNAEARFFGMEHIAVMLLATIVAQIGRIAVKKTVDSTLKHKKALTYFGIALLMVLLMIPWGIWNPARPLFRF
ncbi:hypothetical protein GCM10027594_30620 [Hymenobacter agri]